MAKLTEIIKEIFKPLERLVDDKCSGQCPYGITSHHWDESPDGHMECYHCDESRSWSPVSYGKDYCDCNYLYDIISEEWVKVKEKDCACLCYDEPCVCGKCEDTEESGEEND